MTIKKDITLYNFISSFYDLKETFQTEYDFKNLEKEITQIEKQFQIEGD